MISICVLQVLLTSSPTKSPTCIQRSIQAPVEACRPRVNSDLGMRISDLRSQIRIPNSQFGWLVYEIQMTIGSNWLLSKAFVSKTVRTRSAAEENSLGLPSVESRCVKALIFHTREISEKNGRRFSLLFELKSGIFLKNLFWRR